MTMLLIYANLMNKLTRMQVLSLLFTTLSKNSTLGWLLMMLLLLLLLLIIITDNRNQVELLLVQTSLLSSSDIMGFLSNVEKKTKASVKS